MKFFIAMMLGLSSLLASVSRAESSQNKSNQADLYVCRFPGAYLEVSIRQIKNQISQIKTGLVYFDQSLFKTNGKKVITQFSGEVRKSRITHLHGTKDSLTLSFRVRPEPWNVMASADSYVLTMRNFLPRAPHRYETRANKIVDSLFGAETHKSSRYFLTEIQKSSTEGAFKLIHQGACQIVGGGEK